MDTQKLLKLINAIAVLIPKLAKPIEKLTDYLLERKETSEDIYILKRNLQDQKDLTADVREPVADSTAAYTQEITLKQIEQEFQDSKKRKELTIEDIHAQENIVFKLMLVFALIALVFIISGGFIILNKGLNIVAVLGELVGLVGGAGTLILRQLQDRLNTRATSIEREQDQQTTYLRAIQTALVLTGAEREVQLVKTAEWLRGEMENASK